MKAEQIERLRECCRDEAAFSVVQEMLGTLESEYQQTLEQIQFQSSLLDWVGNAVIARDLDGKITYWNRYAQTLYQWKPEEAIGKSLVDAIVPPIAKGEFNAILAEVAQKGVWKGELLAQRQDGSQFVAEMIDAVILDKSGNVTGFVGISVEASDRLQTENKFLKARNFSNLLVKTEEVETKRLACLPESEPWMYKAIEHLPFDFWACDPSGYYVMQNAICTKHWGCLIGRRLEEIDLSPEVLAIWQNNHRRAMAGEVVQSEVQYLWGNETRTYLNILAPIREKDRVQGIVGVRIDITESKQTQEALLKRLTKKPSLLEAIPDMMFCLSKEGIFLDFKTARDLGAPFHVLIGKKLCDVWPEEREKRAIASQTRSLDTEEVQVFEYQSPIDENSRDYESRIVVAFNDERVANAEPWPKTYVRDLTECKLIELQLRQQTEKERVTSAIAANIRRSLNLGEILNATVEQVCRFLSCDRALIYRFNPDGSAVVAVESVAKDWPSFLRKPVRDPCFDANSLESYQQGFIQIIDECHTANISRDRLKFLADFNIKAHLVVPILGFPEERGRGDPKVWSSGGFEKFYPSAFQPLCFPAPLLPSPSAPMSELWGVLIVHQCCESRLWQQWEIDWLQQLATQVGIAIQQSSLLEKVVALSNQLECQVQERTRQLQQALNFAAGVKRISDKIHDSLDESKILQTAVFELKSVLNVDYCCAVLYNEERTIATIRYEATQPEIGSALGETMDITADPDVHQKLKQGQYYQCSEIGALSVPERFKRLAGKLICPISDKQEAIGYLGVFNEMSYVLGSSEIRLVQQVAIQCAIAIRQARLYQASRVQVEELAKLNRLKDDFLSTVSHELRTPIANMKMAIQMLQIAPDSDRKQRYLKILRDQCDRENELIEDLLDLQKLEAEVYCISCVLLDLTEWLPNIIDPFRVRVQNRQQTLSVEFPAELPPLLSDRTSLARILTELLNNACKYTPSGGEIIFSVEYNSGNQERAIEQGEYTLIYERCASTQDLRESYTNASVGVDILSNSQTRVYSSQFSPYPVSARKPLADAKPSSVPKYSFKIRNQAEIPAAELPRIFEKFYRVPHADPWQQGGTGLGLALVQNLVKQLRGNIQVESGNGWTTFRVEFEV